MDANKLDGVDRHPAASPIPIGASRHGGQPQRSSCSRQDGGEKGSDIGYNGPTRGLCRDRPIPELRRQAQQTLFDNLVVQRLTGRSDTDAGGLSPLPCAGAGIPLHPPRVELLRSRSMEAGGQLTPAVPSRSRLLADNFDRGAPGQDRANYGLIEQVLSQHANRGRRDAADVEKLLQGSQVRQSSVCCAWAAAPR